MAKINEIYRCNHCGIMVEAIVEGAGELVCCGEAMELLEPRQLPEGGVKHIPELVKEAKLWNDFEEIIFCLDNDEAGRAAKEKLLELPHENKFKFFNLLAEGEDFEEFYKRVLVKELYK